MLVQLSTGDVAAQRCPGMLNPLLLPLSPCLVCVGAQRMLRSPPGPLATPRLKFGASLAAVEHEKWDVAQG